MQNKNTNQYSLVFIHLVMRARCQPDVRIRLRKESYSTYTAHRPSSSSSAKIIMIHKSSVSIELLMANSTRFSETG